VTDLESLGAEAAERLAALHARAFDRPFERPWSAKEIAQLLENASAFALLVRHEQQDAGFVLAWAPAAEAEILTLAVAPGVRRLGLGAKLIAAAMAAAMLRGAAEMRLEVADDNSPARALYEKLGFAESGRRRSYYRRENGACDAVLMLRVLPRPRV